MCVIDWWDYGHAFFDAFELEGNVSKAPLKLSNEGAGRGERGLQPQAWREGFLQFCSAHGSWPAPHTEAMAALLQEGWQNLSLEAFHSRLTFHSLE